MAPLQASLTRDLCSTVHLQRLAHATLPDTAPTLVVLPLLLLFM